MESQRSRLAGKNVARLGDQRPTFCKVGEYASTDAIEAVPIFEGMGASFMEYQKDLLDLYFARDVDGNFASRSICVSIPRQNGKSYAARWYCIWMAAHEGMNVLYSCHHGKVARSMFKKICDIVTNDPDLASCLKPNGMGIYKAAGSEGIYFVDENGRDSGMIEFQTRMSANVRGESYGVICVDEAQELTSAQAEGLTPTRMAQANPQTLYIGTPPGPQCLGDVFKSMHDRVHGGESDVWWVEWAVNELPSNGVKRADMLDMAYRTNPAMGTLIREDVMLDTMDTMPIDSFAREILGWWSPTAGKVKHVIDEEAWDALAVDSAPDEGKRAFAVKFSPDGAECVLAVAEKTGDSVHVEVVERMSMAVGTGWLADFATERKSSACCFVIDGKAGAGNLVDKLGKMPPGYIVTPTAAQVVSACSAMVDAVAEKRLTWFKEQQDLRDSAVTSVRRPIGHGGGWGFGGENPVPMEAASLALWGVLNSKRDPERKMRVG